MKNNLKFIVETESTLLPFLLEQYKNKSRNYVKGILTRGQIIVDGRACTNHAHKLRPGQNVEVRLGIPQAQEKMSIPIIYEDNDIIVIDKPAGLLTIEASKEHSQTAYRIVTDYIKSRNKSARIFIVHRLDRDTSGVLLFAKSEKIKNTLQENWDENVLKRGYIALVEGEVTTPHDRIVSWLKQTKTLLVYSGDRENDGKLAITNYETIKATANYSLLDVSLETGRKNQIRVHMKDIGHPIAGDKKYGALTDPIKRLGLHAATLIIKHPSTNEQMEFKSAVPNGFKKALR